MYMRYTIYMYFGYYIEGEKREREESDEWYRRYIGEREIQIYANSLGYIPS